MNATDCVPDGEIAGPKIRRIVNVEADVIRVGGENRRNHNIGAGWQKSLICLAILLAQNHNKNPLDRGPVKQIKHPNSRLINISIPESIQASHSEINQVS